MSEEADVGAGLVAMEEKIDGEMRGEVIRIQECSSPI